MIVSLVDHSERISNHWEKLLNLIYGLRLMTSNHKDNETGFKFHFEKTLLTCPGS